MHKESLHPGDAQDAHEDWNALHLDQVCKQPRFNWAGKQPEYFKLVAPNGTNVDEELSY